MDQGDAVFLMLKTKIFRKANLESLFLQFTVSTLESLKFLRRILPKGYLKFAVKSLVIFQLKKNIKPVPTIPNTSDLALTVRFCHVT